MTLNPRITSLISAALLSACASSPGIPDGDKTVLEVFRTFENAMEQAVLVRPNRDDELARYTRTAENELDQLFPKLENPTLMIYVYPHRAGGLPVPGYMTALPMYAADPFGLPGERRASHASD